MDIDVKKEKLMNGEISIDDLAPEEIEQMKKIVKKEINSKKKELDKLNGKIKDMKTKIDNWSN